VRKLSLHSKGRTALRRRIGVLALLAVASLFMAGAAQGLLKAPVPISPANGSPVGGLPAFAWTPVSGAEEYEFEIAADAGFNSPVLGVGKDDFRTKNTRATLTQTAPNGTYWWRVRAISKNGTPSAWSRGRSIRKSWARGRPSSRRSAARRSRIRRRR
jgi:hypothetical protein